ncbi:formimidoylglutamate deiminase [Affinirhizobium pseudoryzae]|uniref:formimidoylglutamate deiminase n=1 Tax=Allorhizobium pseudoryzae TaxID=379684 RepID=UPI0013EDC5F5|nr:formimidoylglutamate deiminase [Allorhizobium pseudoryzae]
MTTVIFARSALLPQGWARNVRLQIVDGTLATISSEAKPDPGDEQHDVIIPVMPNLHSHAFQRAMAGLAETRGPSADSFWSWRTLMYRFALSMTPDQVQAVAAQLYLEMLEAGFGRVGEFHYLHHDKDGSHYDNIAEMAERIAAASVETGISLTLLPVFYAHSGFGGAEPSEGQRRFIHTLDAFARQMEACRGMTAKIPGARLGLAPHSLRAATADEIRTLLPLAGDGPIHIHIAEQVKEVEDCLAATGHRPVQWLLDEMPVDARWCLIHATHMTAEETLGMAKSGAVAGLCPITEANLGDGIFDGERFLLAGGALGVGSDSNVRISVSEELRQLEYSQRLGLRARNVVAKANGSTGRRLFDEALAGGGQALAAPAGLAEGNSADLVSLSLDGAPYLRDDQILDHWIFSGGVSVDCTWVSGHKLVEKGRHRHRDVIKRRFDQVMRELLTA